MKHDVKEAIDKRHSVRSYQDCALGQDEISELLQAARLAPSSLNSQPWRFKVVTDAETKRWIASKEASRNQAWLADASAIIVCCADLAGYVRDSQAAAFFLKEFKFAEGDTMEGIETYVKRQESASESAKFGAAAMNVGIAVSFMMLRAVEMGLGTCWVGMFNEGLIKERLGIDKDLRVVCLLAVGKPSTVAAPERKRKNLEDILLP